MKLRTPDHRSHPPSARDVLNFPEKERSPYTQLEELFEENRQNIAESAEKNIRDSTDPEAQFAVTDLARTLGATLTLEQVFARPVLPPDLRLRAIATLRAPRLINFFRERLPAPGFDVQMLWFQAAIAQYFPEDRPKLGITNEVFDEWLDRFPNLDDHLSYEDKPTVLSYLAQLRPDQLMRCRKMLEMIGFNQQDLGVETWSFRHELLRRYQKSKAEALSSTRLLQSERCFTDDEKQALLAIFGQKTKFGGFRRSADEYANIAILLASQVNIGPDGKVCLLQSAPPHPSPGLPPRPQV